MEIPAWREVDPASVVTRKKDGWAVITMLILAAIAGFTHYGGCLWGSFFFAVLGWAALKGARERDLVQQVDLWNAINATLRSDVPYVLFLRSFHSNLRHEVIYRWRLSELPNMKPVPGGGVIETGGRRTATVREVESSDDVVQSLCDFLPATHSLLMLTGQRSELQARPFAILSNDDSWRKVFDVLAVGAAQIFILPEPSESLMEEMKRTWAQHLNKLAIVMPPSLGADGHAADSPDGPVGPRRAEWWEAGRRKLPVALPAYRMTGALLVPVLNAGQFQMLDFSVHGVLTTLARQEQAPSTVRQAMAKLHHEKLADPLLDELARRGQSFS